jgi:hypothetical protein
MDITKIQKVALCGKANSGKNTTATLIAESLCKYPLEYKMMAFADPIKEMLLKMFPWADCECLYGSSKLRNNIIPHKIDKDGKSLTYRQALIDLGKLGRIYNEDQWVDVFDHRIKNMCPATGITGHSVGYKLIIATDVRYRNEFEYLKENGYFQIKIFRDSDIIINDSSETNQDQIKNNEFDFILDNNGTLEDLKNNIKKIVSQIRK